MNPGKRIVVLLGALFCSLGCRQLEKPTSPSASAETAPQAAASEAPGADGAFRVETERFADVRILRYRVPGFEELDARRKELIYYLYEASLCGREIIYDQKYRYNLPIKRTLEEIVRRYPGDRTTEEFAALVLYLKQVWFANGIHHHYSNDKFTPGFDYEALARFVKETPGTFPVRPGQSLDEFLAELRPVIFDPSFDAKLVNKKRDADLVEESAVNFYSGLTQREVEEFYDKRRDADDATPVSHGLNSRLVKQDGAVVEKVWKVGGLYTEAIEKVVYWLEKAAAVAENDAQREALLKLVKYYRTGDLEDWDDYNVAWVRDTESEVDIINGFIEVYNDPMGYRGSYESVLSFRDPVATRRIAAIADEAQWFEDNSPILDSHKKKSVQGITGRVIQVVVEAGDASPATPIGINLPNSDWIRKEHGSKSVNLANIVAAYNQVRGEAVKEFAWDQAEIDRAEKFGEISDLLHTDMHEVIGHASGQILPGVGTPKETLKNYASTLEEGRADLVALYFLMDENLVEMGLLPSLDAGRAAYDDYIRNGLMLQLRRLKPGDDIEEDHMRNRQLVARWVLEKGAPEGVIEKRTRDGKTYFVIRDYAKLRQLFGRLLREIQRIKSEGDFAAGQALVETYGVKVDPELHAEVLERYEKLNIPSYSGFINPVLTPVRAGDKITDVRIEFPDDFSRQMLDYAEKYAFLPSWN